MESKAFAVSQKIPPTCISCCNRFEYTIC